MSVVEKWNRLRSSLSFFIWTKEWKFWLCFWQFFSRVSYGLSERSDSYPVYVGDLLRIWFLLRLHVNLVNIILVLHPYSNQWLIEKVFRKLIIKGNGLLAIFYCAIEILSGFLPFLSASAVYKIHLTDLWKEGRKISCSNLGCNEISFNYNMISFYLTLNLKICTGSY